MTRKTNLLAAAVAALAFCAPALAEAPVEYPSTPAAAAQAPASAQQASWQRLARNIAEEVMASLGQFARVTVAPPVGDSQFELTLHELVVSELNARNAFVVVADAHTRKLEILVATSERHTAHGWGGEVLGHAGHKLSRAVGLGSSVKLPPPQAMDVTVSAAIKDAGVYLARRTDVFEVRGADMALFRPSASQLNVVGDRK